MPAKHTAPPARSARAPVKGQPVPRLTAGDATRVAPGDRAITADEFCAIIGVGRSRFYERIAAGEIPPPLRLGASSRWLESEARAILAGALAARYVQEAV